jgi:hypothetical protein
MVKMTATRFKPIEPMKKTPLIYKGNQIRTLKYQIKGTLDTVQEFAQAVSDDVHESGFTGEMQVYIDWPGYGIRSGKYTKFGDEIRISWPDIYDDEEAAHKIDDWVNSTAPKSVMFSFARSETAGGASDKNNDCLFDCLEQAMREDMPWRYPATMKKALNVNRTDKIDISVMPLLDSKLKTYKINVSGDHTYVSPKPGHLQINIKLIKGHYTLQKNESIPVHHSKIQWADRKPIFRENVDNNTKVRVYDGTERTVSKSEFLDICKTNDYIVIPMDARYKGDCAKEYTDFIEKADRLKRETNGVINLYKTGTNIRTAIRLYEFLQKCIRPDAILQTEGEWLMWSTIGAIMYSKAYQGPGYEYDVVSEYPSIMAHEHILFPVRCGTFGVITTEELNALERIPYGIYRCRIQIKQSAMKIFRYNSNEYYTHVDLNAARELKLEIKMNSDGQANQLVYRRGDMVTGKQLFGKYVHYLYDLKNRGVSEAKPILNLLWGYLCKDNIEVHTIDLDSAEPYIIPDDCTLIEQVEINDKTLRFKYFHNDTLFATNYARIKPFILAYGRQVVRSHIDDNLDSIVRIHTVGSNTGHQ